MVSLMPAVLLLDRIGPNPNKTQIDSEITTLLISKRILLLIIEQQAYISHPQKNVET